MRAAMSRSLARRRRGAGFAGFGAPGSALLCRDVAWQGEVDRARTRGESEIDGRVRDGRRVTVTDGDGGFGDRREQACKIDALVSGGGQFTIGRLGRDCDHGGAFQKRGRDSGYEIGRAGAERGGADSGNASQLAGDLRHPGGAGFVAG